MTAFWDIAPCGLVEVDLNETIRRYIPDGCPLHNHSHDNLKSNKGINPV
jgi:hypothetical protein